MGQGHSLNSQICTTVELKLLSAIVTLYLNLRVNFKSCLYMPG